MCIRAQCGHTASSDRSAPRLPVPAVLRVLLHRRLRAARIAASIVRALRHARLGEFVQKRPHPLHRFRLGLGQVVALRRVTLNLCAAACRLDKPCENADKSATLTIVQRGRGSSVGALHGDAGVCTTASVRPVARRKESCRALRVHGPSVVGQSGGIWLPCWMSLRLM